MWLPFGARNHAFYQLIPESPIDKGHNPNLTQATPVSRGPIKPVPSSSQVQNRNVKFYRAVVGVLAGLCLLEGLAVVLLAVRYARSDPSSENSPVPPSALELPDDW
jgi:hypothetical protein